MILNHKYKFWEIALEQFQLFILKKNTKFPLKKGGKQDINFSHTFTKQWAHE